MARTGTIGRRAAIPAAHGLVHVLQGYLPTRDEFFTTLGRAAADLGFAGTLSWQVLLGHGTLDETLY